MTRGARAVLAGTALVAGALGALGAQAGRTTLDGAFTREQAERGKDTYLALCQSCHVGITHTGPSFQKHWAGRPLSELYTFVATRMPKNDPGTLAPETVADLVAYILLLNKMPAGPAEVAPEAAPLAQVMIRFAPPPRRAKR